MFSRELSYADWYTFNNAQRAHQSLLEGLPGFYAVLACASLRHPALAAGCGAVYGTGRYVYARGYSKHGPAARGPGAILSALAFFTALGVAVFDGVAIARAGK